MSNTQGQTYAGVGSLFEVAFRPDAKVYRYDVEIHQDKRILTKNGSDDGIKALNRRLCHDVVRVVYQRYNFLNENARGAKNSYVYDGKKNLFVKNCLEYTARSFEVSHLEILPEIQRYLSDRYPIRVEIQLSSNPVLELNDLSTSLQPNLAVQADHSLRNFLEILTSQQYLNDRSYDVIDAGLLFERKIGEQLGHFCETRKGFQKGARIIDNYGKHAPAIVIDVKTSLFYRETDMNTIMRDFCHSKDVSELAELIKGVRAFLDYAAYRTIVIDGFSSIPMNQITIKFDDGEISFTEYYKKKQILIVNSSMPAIKVVTKIKGTINESYFPPQCVVILPCQRIPLTKMSRDWQERLLAINSTPPKVRHDEILAQVSTINSEFLHNFGVKINYNTCQVTFSQRHLPDYKFQNALLTSKNLYKIDAPRGPQKYEHQFLNPAKIGKWLFCYKAAMNTRDSREVEASKNALPSRGPPRGGRPDRVFQPRDVARDWKGVVNEARKLGIDIPDPVVFPFRGDLAPLDELFAEAKKKGCRFLMLYDEKKDKTHEKLKALELKEKIITQHVTYETIHRAGSATFRNVCLKLNMKNFGLNYQPLFGLSEASNRILDLNSNQILVFAYDVSHPAAATNSQLHASEVEGLRSLEPSVVGFTANMASHPYNFIGDYFYQVSCKESVDTAQIKHKVEYCIKKAQSNRPNFAPRAVFVIRDGLSEGQFEMAYTKELPAIREALKSFNFHFNPMIIFTIVTKKHNKRFFGKNNTRIENPSNCSVVDAGVVRPDVHEFYMISHYPRMGTAKLPQYAVIANDAKVPANQLQEFMNVMCHLHQVSIGGVSLPAPVFVAHELAKRGKNNYSSELRSKNVQLSLNPNFDNLNNRLVYENIPGLSDTRFNA